MYCDPISGIKELEIVSFYFCVLQIETRNDFVGFYFKMKSAESKQFSADI